MSAASVRVLDLDWQDARRSRSVPVRVYLRSAGEPAPLVVFSHGIGGTREGYAYLGRHWAEHGYVVIHPTHLGSDLAALRAPAGRLADRLRTVLADLENLERNPRDVSFVIDQAPREAALAGRIDASRIAVAGHSFGAYTALAIVGMGVSHAGRRAERLPERFFDARVAAAICMSTPSAPRLGITPQSWSSIERPLLHIIGSRDEEIDGVGPAGRRTAFDHARSVDQFLLWIDGLEHMGFTGQDSLSDRLSGRHPRHHPLICDATLAFLNAQLRGDLRALAALRTGALSAHSIAADQWEFKAAG